MRVADLAGKFFGVRRASLLVACVERCCISENLKMFDLVS